MDLTPEQHEAQEQAAQASHEMQVAEFRDAISMTLKSVNMEMMQNGTRPSTAAVIDACVATIGEFIAMDPDRNSRRKAIVAVVNSIPKAVTARTGAH